MKKKQTIEPVKPKGIRIEVIENGVLTSNVRIPFFVVKMGLKLGQMAEYAQKKGRVNGELERLKDIDMEAILEALGSGELTLPCLLAEVDEQDKNQYVKITLE